MSFVESDLNQIKIESVPDIHHSSMSIKTPTWEEPDQSDVGDSAPVMLVNVPSTILVPNVHQKSQHGTLISKDCVDQPPFYSPFLSPRDDPIFKFVQLEATLAANRKKKVFIASLICKKKWEKLCPSDQMRLYELVQLKVGDLSGALKYLHIPPFPTANEMAPLVIRKRKRTASKRSSKKIAAHHPQAQKPAVKKTSSMQTRSTSSLQTEAAKVSQAKQQVTSYVSPKKRTKKAAKKSTSAKAAFKGDVAVIAKRRSR